MNYWFVPCVQQHPRQRVAWICLLLPLFYVKKWIYGCDILCDFELQHTYSHRVTWGGGRLLTSLIKGDQRVLVYSHE